MEKNQNRIRRMEIRIRGIVQGVGFRPFVNRLAEEYRLTGFVRNTSSGAELELQGPEDALSGFLSDLRKKKPLLAVYESIVTRELPEVPGEDVFRIARSMRQEKRDTLISPDIGICPDCLKELFDPGDRRYRHPFINCTNCGPRFTIIRDVPYDRDKTTMADFPMCPECAREYTDIRDRRYHAQPVCCPKCGPELLFLGADGSRDDADPVGAAQRLLRNGGILAVKGLGGFHLAARADSPEIAGRLRARKHRDEKPFALMCADCAEAERFCRIGPEEKELLKSFRRPIVLLKKKEKDAYAWLSENGRLGIMLPYTPVHYLLLHEDLKTLIMTSANRSEVPMLIRNEEALSELSGIADGFLLNDRGIHVRCDDSVLWCVEGHEYFARRSRGYVPYPVTLGEEPEGPSPRRPSVLACGAEQKASFALSKGDHAFPSQHIGDLKNAETLDNYETQIRHFERLFDIRPEGLVCDLHPDYLSSVYASERAEREGLRLLQVQHHWAHMASCMADNGISGECIGIVWDGVGLGTDGTAWGGEFLTGDFRSFERRGTLKSFRLPGGDRAVREIRRIGAALLLESLPEGKAGCLFGQDPVKTEGIRAAGAVTDEELALAEKLLRLHINCPETTSIGRLFDGVSALLGIKGSTSYEGQGAILLEACADETEEGIFPYEIIKEDGLYRFDWRPMIRAIFAEMAEASPADTAPGTRAGALKDRRAVLAARFMNTLVFMASDMCCRIREDTGFCRVVLSGGSFQNLYVLERLLKRLRAEGFEAYCHRRVSPNDEGISLGQLAIGMEAFRDGGI